MQRQENEINDIYTDYEQAHDINLYKFNEISSVTHTLKKHLNVKIFIISLLKRKRQPWFQHVLRNGE